MSRCIVCIENEKLRLPITPNDTAWCEDGRVFVSFKDSDFVCLVGTIQHPVISGHRPIHILFSPNPYEFVAEVDVTRPTCLLCRGRGIVDGIKCKQCKK